jgi:hypothetical protein
VPVPLSSRSRASAGGQPPARERRRGSRICLLAGVVLGLGWRTTALAADEVTVPPRVQAELLAKIVGYDRDLTARAGDRWRILILTRASDPESERVARQFAGALAELRTIQSLPHEELFEDFVDGPALAAACRSRRVSIVYVAPGLVAEVPAIAAALAGTGVLTVAAVPEGVARGLVLGFDLVSGKKQILLSLPRLRTQGIRFTPALLKLAKVSQ